MRYHRFGDAAEIENHFCNHRRKEGLAPTAVTAKKAFSEVELFGDGGNDG